MNDILQWFNPTRWIALAVISAALVAGYFFWADSIGDTREAKVRAEYAQQAAVVDVKRDAVAAPIAAQQEVTQAEIRTVTKTLIQKVNVYVPTNSCPLPGGFRLLTDAAATNGKVPDTPAELDAAAVSAQDAATTVVENYGIARANAARLVGLQEWVKAQSALK